MTQHVLDAWNPTADELLRLVIENTDESMLREISEADYGMDADAHYAAIIKLIRPQNFTSRLEWEPREVLELTRWSEPDDPAENSGATGERGHWMRLFSCTMLLRVGAERQNREYLDEKDTLIQFILSAIALGRDAMFASLRFLCWFFLVDLESEGEYPMTALAISILALKVNDYDESRIRYLVGVIQNHEESLSGMFHYCVRQDAWIAVVKAVFSEPPCEALKPLRGEINLLK